MKLHRTDDIKVDLKDPSALQKLVHALNKRFQAINNNSKTLEGLHESQNKDIKKVGKDARNISITNVSSGGGGGSVTLNVPELDTDPLFPANGETWVRRLENVGQAAGKYMGVGGLTYSGIETSQHELSYKTESHGVKRVLLTA